MAATVQESIDVAVPVRTAYNQWTQFESFPKFMEGVESVQQIDPTHTHWRVRVGGAEREFDATITEQLPDERIAWKSTGGTRHAGVVTFHRLADDATRVTVQMDWQPEGLLEKAGSMLGLGERRVKADLRKFKAFIESRGTESGEWRGQVRRPEEREGAARPEARETRETAAEQQGAAQQGVAAAPGTTPGTTGAPGATGPGYETGYEAGREGGYEGGAATTRPEATGPAGTGRESVPPSGGQPGYERGYERGYEGRAAPGSETARSEEAQPDEADTKGSGSPGSPGTGSPGLPPV